MYISSVLLLAFIKACTASETLLINNWDTRYTTNIAATKAIKSLNETLMLDFKFHSLSLSVEAILTNAVKYTKEGTISLSVKTIKQNNNCKVIIVVEDTGMGMKKEDLDVLFTKFQRFDLEKNSTKKASQNINIDRLASLSRLSFENDGQKELAAAELAKMAEENSSQFASYWFITLYPKTLYISFTANLDSYYLS